MIDGLEAKPFKIISPEGIIFEGIGIDKCLKEFGLSLRLRYLINGKVNNYRGWTRI